MLDISSSWRGLLVILITCGIVYSATFEFEFLTSWDDHQQVTENHLIESLGFENIKAIFSSYTIGMYQPLATLTFALQYHFSGLNAGHFHFVNLLIHLFNIVLVFAVISKITKRNIIGLFVAALFAIHPTNVETVAWISTRSTLLFVLFFLSAWLAYLEYSRSRKIKLYILTLLFFLLSCFSKSMAVTFPAVVLLYDFLIKGKITSRMWLEKIPLFGIAIYFGLKSLAFLNDDKYAETILYESHSLIEIFLYSCYSFFFYITSLIMPVITSPAHYFPGEEKPLIIQVAPVIVLLFIALVYRLRKNKMTLFWLLFFAGNIVLVLYVPARRTIVSERYNYLSQLGVFTFLALSLLQIIEKKPKFKLIVFSSSLVFISFFLIGTIRYIPVWKNTLNLFDDIAQKQPKNYHPFASRAIHKMKINDSNGALKDLNKALLLNPEYHEGYYNRAKLYAEHKKEFQKAFEDYNKAIQLNTSNAKYFLGRGMVYRVAKQYELAMKDLNKSLELNPSYAKAYENRGVIKADLKDFKGAIKDYSKALAINPHSYNTYNSRGAAKDFLKDYNGAISDYNKALKIQPNDFQTICNVGIAYYQLKNHKKACEAWKKAADNELNYAKTLLKNYCTEIK